MDSNTKRNRLASTPAMKFQMITVVKPSQSDSRKCSKSPVSPTRLGSLASTAYGSSLATHSYPMRIDPYSTVQYRTGKKTPRLK